MSLAHTPRWRIYRHPDCARCARYARTRLALDWRGLLKVSTAAPASGALQMGEAVVEDLADERLYTGAQAFERICRGAACTLPAR